MAPVKLYHADPSPFSRGALLAIRNLDLDVEVIPIDLLKGEQMQDWFLKLNPQHLVPVLDDNGFVVTESRVIMSYLVNTRAPGSSLYPSDPKKRAVVDHRLFFSATVLGTRGTDIVFPIIFDGVKSIPANKAARLREGFDWLNDFLATTKWVAGDDLTIADLSFAPMISGVVAAGFDLNKYPNIKRWYKECEKIKGFEESLVGAERWGFLIKNTLKTSLEEALK